MAKHIPETQEIVGYVMRYGGRCRDCADEFGICPNSGLPCDSKLEDKAIRHVIRAINYGVEHGFINIGTEVHLDEV